MLSLFPFPCSPRFELEGKKPRDPIESSGALHSCAQCSTAIKCFAVCSLHLTRKTAGLLLSILAVGAQEFQ